MTDFTPRYLKDYQQSAYRIPTVNLHIELDDERTLVRNVMSIEKADSSAASQALVLDGHHMELVSVKIDEQPLSDAEYQRCAGVCSTRTNGPICRSETKSCDFLSCCICRNP